MASHRGVTYAVASVWVLAAVADLWPWSLLILIAGLRLSATIATKGAARWARY